MEKTALGTPPQTRSRESKALPHPLGLFRPMAGKPAHLELDLERLGGVHDIAGPSYRDGPAALGFCRALLTGLAAARQKTDDQTGQTILWAQTVNQIREFGQPYGPGLKSEGLDPDGLILLTAPNDTETLWAMEEGLKSNAVLAVVGEITQASFTATRRLALAAALSATPCFLIHSFEAAPSAATTRWHVSSRPGAPNRWHNKAPGNPRWHLELVRNRGSGPCSLDMEWTHETHTFRLVAAPAPRPAEQRNPHTNKGIRKLRNPETANIVSWRRYGS